MPLLEIGPAIVTTLKICILLAAIWFIRFTPTTLHFEIRTGTLQFLHYGDTARQVGDVSVAVLYLDVMQESLTSFVTTESMWA